MATKQKYRTNLCLYSPSSTTNKKVGLDYVSTDFQAVARHFGRLERMA